MKYIFFKMNTELQLKLQSWVDGELAASEARQMAALVEQDVEACALAAELRMTHGFLVGNEPQVKLPESVDFHWSKIRREIERQEAAGVASQDRSVDWLAAARRFLAPLSGVALVAFVSVVSLNLFNAGKVDDPTRQLVETESLSEHIGSISYKSQAENMFVVYLYDKDTGALDADVDVEPTDDMVIQ